MKLMNAFDLISKYFWIAAILFTATNFLFFRKRSEAYIKANPQLLEGYIALFRGYLFWMNLPWIIMGLGCTVGGVPSVWYYFRPKDGNPYVLAWFGSVFVLWILGTLWLFFKGGAQKLSEHPGAIELSYGFKRQAVTDPGTIKTFWLLALAGGIAGVALMWFIDFPILTTR